jgi:hypothetical protein
MVAQDRPWAIAAIFFAASASAPAATTTLQANGWPAPAELTGYTDRHATYRRLLEGFR